MAPWSLLGDRSDLTPLVSGSGGGRPAEQAIDKSWAFRDGRSSRS